MPMRMPLLTVFFPLWQVVAQAPLRARERAMYRLAQLGAGRSSVPGSWVGERSARLGLRSRCDCSATVLGGRGTGVPGGWFSVKNAHACAAQNPKMHAFSFGPCYMMSISMGVASVESPVEVRRL